MRILITGATGFIGRHLLLTLKHTEHTCCAVTRRPGVKIEGADEYVCIDLFTDEALKRLPTDFDVVVHLADGFSQNREETISGQEIKKRIRHTTNLAKWAKANNVRDFIYVSSVSAELDKRNAKSKPRNIYGTAKRFVEDRISKIFENENTRLVVLRNPVIYGPGCNSNFRELLRRADTPWPVPVKKLEGYWSTVSVTNCCDAIRTVIDTPQAPGGTYHIADDGQITTGEIINVFRQELGRKSRVFTVPGWFSRLTGTPARKQIEGAASNQDFREHFGWFPTQTTQQSLIDMARNYAKGGS